MTLSYLITLNHPTFLWTPFSSNKCTLFITFSFLTFLIFLIAFFKSYISKVFILSDNLIYLSFSVVNNFLRSAFNACAQHGSLCQSTKIIIVLISLHFSYPFFIFKMYNIIKIYFLKIKLMIFVTMPTNLIGIRLEFAH